MGTNPADLPVDTRFELVINANVAKALGLTVPPTLANDGDRMKRRTFLLGVSGAAAYPLSTLAQHGERMRRVAVLIGTAEADPETKSRVTVLVEQLRQRGWNEGRNIQFDYRITNDVAHMRDYASEVVSLGPDVIMVHSNPFLAALRQVNRTIPTVFAQVADPIGSGFVESLARPGGNLTGFTNFDAEMGGKWLNLLKEMAPRLTRALVLLHQETAANVAFLRAAETAARSLQMSTTAAGVHNAAEIEQAIFAFAQQPDGGVVAIPHVVTGSSRDLIAALAMRHRLPTIVPFRSWMASNGGLMAYGIDVVDLFRRAADYVDRILRGTKPSDLPVQNPTLYQMVLNLKTAKALGLTVPPTLLAFANEVIE
jgi:putative tryptophan/tyrosine transport system substrate-binding protein